MCQRLRTAQWQPLPLTWTEKQSWSEHAQRGNTLSVPPPCRTRATWTRSTTARCTGGRASSAARRTTSSGCLATSSRSRCARRRGQAAPLPSVC